MYMSMLKCVGMCVSMHMHMHAHTHIYMRTQMHWQMLTHDHAHVHVHAKLGTAAHALRSCPCLAHLSSPALPDLGSKWTPGQAAKKQTH